MMNKAFSIVTALGLAMLLVGFALADDSLNCRLTGPCCDGVDCEHSSPGSAFVIHPVTGEFVPIEYGAFEFKSGKPGVCDDGGGGCVHRDRVACCIAVYFPDVPNPCDQDEIGGNITMISGCERPE